MENQIPKRSFGRNVPPHDRPPVAWYQIGVLFTAARELLSSLDQLRNGDPRDLYPLPMTVIDRSDERNGEDFWFDFIADTGDGGNASYAVASAAMQESLPVKVDGGKVGELPRGEVLLLGGDLAYPTASSDEYRYRFVEMFEAVRNSTEPSFVRGRPFTLAAVAQNHDWMDSASTFRRYFMRGRTSAPLLGAEIPQRQSYFCVKLPGRWWALGLDFALVGDIDPNQFDQFESLLSRQDGIGKDDNVLLVYPEPYWTRPLGDGATPPNPKRYQLLEGLLGDRVRLRLAGDLHHYMRWDAMLGEQRVDGHLVTCGTGGAFTHPTHTRMTTDPIIMDKYDDRDRISPEIAQKPAVAIGRVAAKNWRLADDQVRRFVRNEDTVYPNSATSRRRALGNITALLLPQNGSWPGNQTFAWLLGILYWLTAYITATPFHESFVPDDFMTLWKMPLSWDQYCKAALLWLKAMIYSPIGMILNVLMVAGCVVLGRGAAEELETTTGRYKPWFWTVVFGLLHGATHALAVFSLQFVLQTGVAAALGMHQETVVGFWTLLAHSLLVGFGMIGLGGIVGALLFGSYLAVMSLARLLTNNGYSALGIQDFKGFLRFRIAPDGRLDGYFVALDSVPRRWVPSDRGPGHPIWSPERPKKDVPETSARVHDVFRFAPRERSEGSL